MNAGPRAADAFRSESGPHDEGVRFARELARGLDELTREWMHPPHAVAALALLGSKQGTQSKSNNEKNANVPMVGGLVLGCIEADFCKYKLTTLLQS